MTARRATGDGGLTLVELLMSMAVLTIIIAAITGSMITFLQNGTYTIERDDHTGGAAVLSTYLNRDLGSADVAPTTTATPCSGTGVSVLNLQWTEWTASAASPSPAPNGGTWRVSYVVTHDAPAVGGGTRYQLQRRLCRPTAAVENALILRNISAPSASGVLTLSSSVSSACPAGLVAVTLSEYGQDQDAHSYKYSGCVRGRLR